MKRLFLSAVFIFAYAQSSFPQTPASASNPTTPSGNPALKTGGPVTPPVLIHSATPKLPPFLQTGPKGVNVDVGLTVDEKGRPIDLHILKSDNFEFDKISLDSVSTYQFKPATQRGHPIAVKLVVKVNWQAK